MRIRFIKYTNTRIGGASKTFQKGPVRLPGEELEVEGLIKGQQLLENDDWYFDGTDKYYWSGGASEIPDRPIPLAAPSEKAAPDSTDYSQYIQDHFDGERLLADIDYNFLLPVPDAVKQAKGNGVTVVILDHPIKTGLVLKNPVERPLNAGPPKNSHGTFMAGLIAGASGVLGVAPDVNVIEFPTKDSRGVSIHSDVLKPLFDSLSTRRKPIVMNISQDLTDVFRDLLDGLEDVLVVASAGRDEELLKEELSFPASLPGVIAIGVISRDFYQSHPSPVFNGKLDFILPDLQYVSDSIGARPFESGTGDSCAAAIVSGMVALLLSAGGAAAQPGAVKEKLTALSKPYSSNDLFSSLNSIIPPK